MNKRIILASKSPRRKEILTKMGYDFTIKESDFIENSCKNDPVEIAKDFALGKAKSVFNSLSKEEKKSVLVIGADTVVCAEGEIMGKPIDRKDAIRMITKLSTCTHQVITGYAVVGEGILECSHDTTSVSFKPLTREQIEKYVDEFEPYDKAGAYGIQDEGFVINYEGSYDNIVGFPSEKVGVLLKKILD